MSLFYEHNINFKYLDSDPGFSFNRDGENNKEQREEYKEKLREILMTSPVVDWSEDSMYLTVKLPYACYVNFQKRESENFKGVYIIKNINVPHVYKGNKIGERLLKTAVEELRRHRGLFVFGAIVNPRALSIRLNVLGKESISFFSDKEMKHPLNLPLEEVKKEIEERGYIYVLSKI